MTAGWSIMQEVDGTGGPAVGGLRQNVSGLTVGSLYTTPDVELFRQQPSVRHQDFDAAAGHDRNDLSHGQIYTYATAVRPSPR